MRLRTVLGAAVLSLLLVASLGVGLNAWISLGALVQASWQDTAATTATTATRASRQVSLHLGDAQPVVDLSEHLVDQGLLDVDDHDAVLDHATSMLQAWSNLTWLSWSSQDGDFAAALWWPGEDGRRLRKDLRLQTAEGTWHRQWELRDEAWVLVLDEVTDYDPRTRPWYQTGLVNPQGTWVGPYLFVSRQQPGITWARASDGPDGTRGVWTSDFECGPLSDWLSTVQVSPSGRVYLVDDSGAVIAHPRGRVAAGDDLLLAQDHPDPWLATAWADRPDDSRPFTRQGRVATVHPLQNVPWNLVLVVPEDEVYGNARQVATQAALFTVALLAIALAWGLVFSGRLSRTITAVEEQLVNIAHFELSDVELSDEPSWLREVNRMADAHDRMQQALRSFGRYVPRPLVRQLMVRGEQAEAGAVEREVTVLFCDVAGFTGLVEDLDSDTLMTALSEYLTALDDIIEAHGGVVVQYLGDAIMAAWNAPIERPDHAQLAVVAAVAMRDKVQELIEAAPSRGLPALPTRIGVHTGRCLVGNVGGKERFSYTVVGEGVRTAERMESLNKQLGTRLLISAETARRLGPPLVTRPSDHPDAFRVQLSPYTPAGRRSPDTR